MRGDTDLAAAAAIEAVRRASDAGPETQWATVQAGGSPARILMDGDTVAIQAQPTVGAVLEGDYVRVERRDSGATLIVGVKQ